MNSQPINEAIVDPGAAMEIAEPIIRAIVSERCRAINSHDRADIRQAVRLKLWETVVPKFDRTRGSTLTAFIRRSVINAVADEMRRLKAIQRHGFRPLDDGDVSVVDTTDADTVLADLLSNPREHLSRIKSELLKLALCTTTRLELASALGVDCDVAAKRMTRLVNDIRVLV